MFQEVVDCSDGVTWEMHCPTRIGVAVGGRVGEFIFPPRQEQHSSTIGHPAIVVFPLFYSIRRQEIIGVCPDLVSDVNHDSRSYEVRRIQLIDRRFALGEMARRINVSPEMLGNVERPKCIALLIYFGLLFVPIGSGLAVIGGDSTAYDMSKIVNMGLAFNGPFEQAVRTISVGDGCWPGWFPEKADEPDEASDLVST